MGGESRGIDSSLAHNSQSFVESSQMIASTIKENTYTLRNGNRFMAEHLELPWGRESMIKRLM